MHFQPIEPMSQETQTAGAGAGYHADINDASASPDILDDVFGSGPPSPTLASHNAHPSDMRRLETEHATNGYREGVATAKETSIQAGFDEGFSLGASVGLKAGQLLGLLEGIADAVRGRDDAASVEAVRLAREAKVELSVEGVFNPEFWADDGNWKYEVEGQDGNELVFADVADAHPLIRKWTAVVDAQVAMWKIDRSLLDDESAERLEAVKDEPIATSVVPTARKPLDW
ncbi:hypothetical protein G7046_g7799 [Stylonectria norvegica]|nr:hypothetical protein G7046_g7799 [Stylonectria norvegica]